MCAKSASRLCECCAPRRTPPPETIRSTSGRVGVAAHHEPQLRRLVHDLVERDAGEVRELELDDGAQARSAPHRSPQPTKPLSVSGVSRIRSAP